MRAHEIITELRKSTMNHFIKKYPNIPEYVVQDFIYKNNKDNPKSANDAEYFMELNDMSWKLETVNITLDIFDEQTQIMLKPRLNGLMLSYVSNDEERHNTQLRLLKTQGSAKEPIILTTYDDKYVLQEGWHRTIQSLLLWPKGYDQIAWVGRR